MNKVDFEAFTSAPMVSTEEPMYVLNNKAYISTEYGNRKIKDQTSIKSFIILDLSSGHVSRLVPRPNLYNEGAWGMNYILYRMCTAYNSKTGDFVFNYGADPFLYVTDLNHPVKKYFVGSKNFKNIEPMDNSDEDDMEKSTKYEFTTPWYYNIIFDPTQNLYYRIAFRPLTDVEFDNENIKFNRPFSVIIANNNFKKIGEFKMPENTFTFYNYFVNKEGFHIMLNPNLQKSEDSIYYVRFKIKKI
jgi:hypothetical protein